MLLSLLRLKTCISIFSCIDLFVFTHCSSWFIHPSIFVTRYTTSGVIGLIEHVRANVGPSGEYPGQIALSLGRRSLPHTLTHGHQVTFWGNKLTHKACWTVWKTWSVLRKNPRAQGKHANSTQKRPSWT